MVLRSSKGTTTPTALWTAAADPRIAQTIESVLMKPAADWTIERLSRTAAMSRSTFLRHFGQETGMTVSSFVTRVRVMAAADLLSSSDATVATVAAEVGYQSESAFSRAFRAEVERRRRGIGALSSHRAVCRQVVDEDEAFVPQDQLDPQYLVSGG